ncbi:MULTISPECIES: substrate-binding periplasmic protein [Nitrincola]|uniref:Lysine-arginine-ornithine-binding periplasmic protein n=1 Tax=Nitrincola nitratireducens TaxID=1229521 RepID=W9UQ64_9GAMM|nr:MULTISPECIES: transporter substrate-binding domain-containing protein [Nitrincola]EXJ09259.1 Lysine-arginine-ornithine-binding periplasmic protein precursor [Nitrincola nitratireducens]
MRRIKRKILFMWMLLFISVSLVAAPLRVAIEGNYPPFSYVDDSGQVVGFDIDITHALCAAMGVECEMVLVEWSEILTGLVAGDYELIIASMGKTPEREKSADFSDYYYRAHSVFVGDPKLHSKKHYDDLKHLRIATGKDTLQSQYLVANYPHENIHLLNSHDEAIDALIKGEVDLVLSNSISQLHFLQSADGENFDFISEPLVNELLVDYAHIAVRKNHPELLLAVNEGLKKIRFTGQYDQINRKYIPFSIY